MDLATILTHLNVLLLDHDCRGQLGIGDEEGPLSAARAAAAVHAANAVAALSGGAVVRQ